MNDQNPKSNIKDKTISVRLWCNNLRIAFAALSLIFWVFSLVFFCDIATHSDNAKLAIFARSINDFFGNSIAFMLGPVIIGGTLMYYLFSRKTITWSNGLVINDAGSISVEYFQIKRFSHEINLIYLQSGRHLWILYPATSEDLKRFKDVEVVNREVDFNAMQVDLLNQKLIASGATEKRFWFFTKNVVISLLIYILIMVWTIYV